ncbi:MAG: twin-arginine translocase TatA/TatE family subunit [Candidatus Aminicenantes bacterium]|nr:twin-arginine translocase TatA/TatE family subunit [Candidatus Aminicenantes bacterium]
MFGSLGFWEILLIFLIIAFLFGGKKLPELGRGLGEGIRNFKKSISREKDKDKEKDSDNETVN